MSGPVLYCMYICICVCCYSSRLAVVVYVPSIISSIALSQVLKIYGMAISPTGGVFSYLPHHLDLASEDSVGHSTCMSVLARRRAIMGSIVQPKRSCLGLTL